MIGSIRWLVVCLSSLSVSSDLVTTELTTTTSRAYVAPALSLLHIYSSHGDMSPNVVLPGIYKYVISLNEPLSSVGLIPQLNRSGYDLVNLSEDVVPQVFVDWPGRPRLEPEADGFAVKKQIPLPSDGSDLPVTIDIFSRQKDKQKVSYKIVYKQTHLPPPELVFIEGTDDTGKPVLVDPVMMEDTNLYKIYVDPKANSFTLNLKCKKGATIKVNNKPTTKVTLKREKYHHTQIVQVSCSREMEYPGIPMERRYGLLVMSDYSVDGLTPPNLIVDGLGRECRFVDDRQEYECPDPKSDNRKTRMVSHNHQDIKYMIHSKDNSIEVRLADMQPTIPFSYTSKKLFLSAIAGQQTKVWPIVFAGSAFPSILGILGWILALILGFLLFALLLVVGLSSVFGLGVPLGATEIAATLTFIIQYLCFANYIRQGSPMLNEMVAPLKWVTLFWPLPFHASETMRRGRQLMAVDYASDLGVSLWGDSALGDVTDIRNACGCIFWSQVILVTFFLLHCSVWFKFYVLEKEYTCPHRIAFGNWESRCAHWLAFPTAAGATMILASDISTGYWKILGGLTLAGYFCWIGFVLFEVYGAVSSHSVSWVWNASMREDGLLEDESGYWSDVQSDQLLTQPVNRSLCRGFFPFRWISTVADILPVSLSHGLGTEPSFFPPATYNARHDETTYSLAKNPQVVEVVKTRAPGGPCNGQRLISGLLRTQWIDILFTFQALTTFHSHVNSETGQFTVPLIVKTSQLSGPLASGRHAFFYDGSRIPFIRICDFLYRILVGVCIGVALAQEGPHPDTAMFACIAVMSFGLLTYVAVLRPYSRMKENWMFVALLATVMFSASSFVFYGAMSQNPSDIADVFLWLVAICCFLLAAYSCVVIFSVFTALFCPPLEESRFLEKLANCSLTISNDLGGWNVEVPAFSKYPVRDIEVRCTETGTRRLHVTVHSTRNEPSLEFSSQAVRQACRGGLLPIPIATLFVSSGMNRLGYRHCNLEEPETLIEDTVDFLVTDATSAFNEHTALELAKHIGHQIQTKARNQAILCITIVPPRP